MSENYFVQHYGTADQSPERISASGISTSSDEEVPKNYFTEKYGAYVEPEVPAPEEKPGVMRRFGDWLKSLDAPSDQQITGFFKPALEGAAEGAHRTEGTLRLAAGVPIQLFEKIDNTVNGTDSTAVTDYMFKNVIEPQFQASEANALKPDASTSEKVMHAVGGTAEALGEIFMTGGAAAPEVLASKTAMQGVTQNVLHGARAMQAPAISNAVDAGRKTLNETGDNKLAAKAAVSSYFQNLLAGVAPLSVKGNLATRVGSGVMSGTASAEAGRALNNAIMPEDRQQPFSLEDTAIAGGMGGIMGGVMGPRGTKAPKSIEPVKAGPVDAIDTAFDTAAQRVAAEGGDALDQVLAGTKAHIEHAAAHDEAFLNASHTLRDGQQAAEDAVTAQQERIAALLDSSKPVAPELPKVSETPATAEDAFALKEQQEAAQKDSDYQNALLQQEAQKGVEAEFAPTGEPLATLAEAPVKAVSQKEAKRAAKTLLERREQDAAQKKAASVQEKEPFTESEQSKKVDNKPVTEPVILDSRTENAPEQPKEKQTVEEPKSITPAGHTNDLVKRREIEEAAHEAATSPKNDRPEPTEAQIAAGNYKKGHLEVHGLDVTIENPKGSTRSGVTPEGRPWSRELEDHYGYIRGTEGSDGDHVDTFIGDHPSSDKVYVIDQIKQSNGAFDEHKTMVGYPNQLAAVRAYKRNYQKGWKVGPVKEMSVPEFKDWLKNGDTTKPLQPEKIFESVPASEADVSLMSSAASKRGKQDVRFRLGEELSGVTNSKLGRRQRILAHAEKAPEKGYAVVNTAKGEYTVFKNREPLQTYVDQAHAREDVRALEAEEAKHTVTIESNEDTGEHTARSANGESTAQENGKYLQVKRSDTVKALRGRGEGTARYEQLFAEATKRGLTLASDYSVSPEQQRVYEALRRRGYRVKENEATKNPDTGNLVSKDIRTPVFEVTDGPQKPIEKEQVRARLSANGAGTKPVSKTDIESAIKNTGIAEHVQVHESHADLPPEFQDTDLRAHGFYDSATNTAHVIADKHSSVENAVKTALHETIGHKGIRAILKEKMASIMQDIYDNATIREKRGISATAERYGFDVTKQGDQRAAVEEYIAKLAESNIDSPLLQRAIVAVRAGLRRMGLVKGWSNEDIKGLLRASRKNLSEQEFKADMADRRIRYALGEPDPIVEEQPKNPLSQLAKFGATMESQAKYSPDLVHKVRDTLANFGEDKGRSYIRAFLATMPRDKLPDFMAKGKNAEPVVPSFQRYVDTAHKMDSRRNALLIKDEAVARRWSKLQKKDSADAALMGEVMHAATLSGVDPSVEYQARKIGKSQTLNDKHGEQVRQEQYRALKPYWDRLSPEAKSLYKTVQQHYQEKRALVERALIDRIQESDASPDSKRTLLDTLRQQFESTRVAGPYFPLSRFGEYWAAAKNPAGEVVSASRFETKAEQIAWRANFKELGYSVDGGRNMDNGSVTKSINPEFAAKVTQLVGEHNKGIADSIWQMYMESLPEMSMRKHFMHRQGRLGFSQDALRAFGQNSFHSSHQLARLEYVHRMEGQLRQAEKHVRTLENEEHPEAKWARPLLTEMNARHEWAMNPTSSPIASAITSLGFVYHLIASPAAGVVNLTQTPVVAMPVLAGNFGYFRTTRELLRAATEVAGRKVQSLGEHTVEHYLKGDEAKAMQEATDSGSFGRTQAHMLAGATNEEGFNLTDKRRVAMEVASWFFHKSEEFNRKVTFLAAFRLAKNKGMDYDAAYAKADKLTMDSHFDVSNANRARVMQSGPAKVLTLFKNYSLNMTYRLARDFREAIRTQTDNPELRTAARKRFAGMLGMTALMAGSSGLPLSWLVHAVVNTVFSDPDTDFDSEAALRAHLTEAHGSKVATAITRGPFEAATGLSISSRVGLNNLWLQSAPDNMEGADLTKFYSEQILGPGITPLANIPVAAQSAGQGYWDRALEQVLPKGAADVAKALRYMREGAVNKNGDITMAKDEFTAKQLFFQSVGFVPEELSTRQAEGRVVKAAEQKLLKRRELLLNKYNLALRNDDPEGRDEAMQHILTFDQKNPSIAIGGDSLVSSVKNRAKFNALAENGTTINPKLGYLHNKYRFTQKKETPND